jgi:Arc/MetJ-type ribon-helix-helix transcriptional regulator
MDSLKIHLTESLRDFIQLRLDEGGYATPDDYVVDLIRADQERRAESRLVELVREAVDSGPAVPADDAFWEAKKRQLIERHGAGPSASKP